MKNIISSLFKSRLIVRKFLDSQAIGGAILLITSIAALMVANSNFYSLYQSFLTFSLPINIPFLSIYKEMNVKMWIDDGLMAIFFLLVGLELKREFLVGELSFKSNTDFLKNDLSSIIIPVLGAVGGVVVPMLIYLMVNISEPANLRGIAIPAATDIAFAVAILSLFNNKISNSLKMFLVALAIIDDLIAILIIAIFYSSQIDLSYLGYASLVILALFTLNKFHISSLVPYLILAPFLWLFILKSGVHSTIAGVILAFLIPMQTKNHTRILPLIFINQKDNSPLRFLEYYLHKPVAYFVLPIFAFTSCGLVLNGLSSDIFLDKIVLGIIFGLFFGKQIGIFSVVYLLHKMKIVKFFKDASWFEFYGVSVLAGIGFTMSLFIGNLAFSDPIIIDKMKIGVVTASFISGLFGFIILTIATRKKNG